MGRSATALVARLRSLPGVERLFPPSEGLTLPALKGHLPALDGLRGLAILYVIVFHYFRAAESVRTTEIDKAAYAIAGAGWSGVDLFFILSGFLITGILWDTRGEENRWKTFYARRVLRIFPLYYGFLFVSFYLLPRVSGYFASVPADSLSRASLWAYLTNWKIAFQGWESVPEYMAPFWSLAIEEQFYLIWPFLVFALSRRALMKISLGLIVTAFCVRTGFFLAGMRFAAEAFSFSRMDALALGAIIALGVRDPKDYRTLARFARPVLAATVPLICFIRLWRGSMSSDDMVVGTVGITLVGLMFGSLLVLTATSSPQAILARIFTAAPMRFFGKYSYALYVFHMAVILPLVALGLSAPALIPNMPVLGSLPGLLAFTGVGLVLTIVVSLLSWNLYEKHFLKLKDRFSYGRKSTVVDTGAGGIEGTPAVAPVTGPAIAG